MTPEGLSRELRLGSGRILRRRRQVVSLSLIAAGAMMPITLYQTGIIPHLPEPPFPGLDADTVDAAGEAYAVLATPDAALGLASYAVTASLAAMGRERRAETHPWIPLALAAKVGLDAVFAAKLTRDQWTRHRAFCSWCLLAAGASLMTVPLVIPEARVALRELHNSSRSVLRGAEGMFST
jgi:hypothetical protein